VTGLVAVAEAGPSGCFHRTEHLAAARAPHPLLPAGTPNTKDALLIAGDKLPPFLTGDFTLGDALADLCELPALRQQMAAAAAAAAAAGSRDRPSPFAAAAAVAAEVPDPLDITQPAATATAHGSAELESPDPAEAQLAASIRMPAGLAIGSFSGSRSLSKLASAGASGSHPSLLQLLARDREQQQQQQHHHHHQEAAAAAEASDLSDAAALDEGFANAYLDPPMPTADQLVCC
jgi:hypothetical protein